jgi:Xaa-Pro aminopeptidase
MSYRDRLAKLRKILDSRLDVLLVTHLPNVRYLCGFTGSSGVLVVSRKHAVFFTDGRYTEQAHNEVSGARVVIGRKAALTAAAEWLTHRGKRSESPRASVVGIESEHLTVSSRDALGQWFKGKKRLKNAGPLVETMRMVKDGDETTAIREAVKLGSSVFNSALKVLRPGVREAAVAGELEYAARKAGAEAMSFPTIVAAGKRSALPHARASSFAIPRSGPVVLDFGVILAGYCSDMTRTICVGSVSTKLRRMYQAVLEAQLAGIDAVRAGVTAGEVDRAARTVLNKAGFGRYFTHSTGHGVGLEIHETPRVAAGERQLLQPGMVITIEPGAYIPGEGGVRIEDMVLVTKTGCEVLTPTKKELILI